MTFSYKKFSCNFEVFYSGEDILIRFYDDLKEQSEHELVNLVIVDSGYGFLCLKAKGDSAILSGYLNRNVFTSDEMVFAAIDLVENISPKYKNAYVPYHIELVKQDRYLEYNGEY